MWRDWNQLTENRHFQLRYSSLETTNDSHGRLNLGVLGLSCHRPQMVIKAAVIRCSSHSQSAAARRELWAVLLWLNIQRWLHTCQTYRYTGHAGSVAHAVINNMWPSLSSEEGWSSLNTSGACPNHVNVTWWLLPSRTFWWFTFNPDAYANDRHSEHWKCSGYPALLRSSSSPGLHLQLHCWSQINMHVGEQRLLLAVVFMESEITELVYPGITNALSNDLVSHSALCLIASTFSAFAFKYSWRIKTLQWAQFIIRVLFYRVVSAVSYAVNKHMVVVISA